MPTNQTLRTLCECTQIEIQETCEWQQTLFYGIFMNNHIPKFTEHSVNAHRSTFKGLCGFLQIHFHGTM
jgi:hypothetical protein